MDLGLGFFVCVCAGMSAFETGKLVGGESGKGERERKRKVGIMRNYSVRSGVGEYEGGVVGVSG